ncbi:hypothetical protein K4A85_05715 [Bacillus pumilus]|nr:hypothetical protein K4A85_05715 [Bacillus pumilus]
MLIDMHHIIRCVSMDIHEGLRSLYHHTIEPIEIQYKDYTSWQEKLKKTEFYHKQEEYWMKELAGELPVLHLPTDFPRPAIQKFDGKLYSYEFDPTLAQKLVEFSSNQGVTLFITLLAAYNALLYKYSGQEDILIGSPIVGRSNPELENVIGMFANTIVFRNYPTGGLTFREFLQSVKERSVSVYENADYLFEELVENWR